ncbi:MAG: replicative DNA helicase [Planctomycetota bacterium]|nr:replicative DNA helicase [Planctomycetota bacterium]
MPIGRTVERESSVTDRPMSPAGSAGKILEQVPPYDERAEVGVLGSMLIDARAADVAIEELKAEDFYLPRHRTIFSVFSRLFQKHENVDEVFLCSELEREGLLEAVGGRDMIGRLITDTPSAASVESYCAIVRARAVERELIEAAGKILKLVREPSSQGGDALVEAAEQMVYDIADKRTTDDAVPMTKLMAEVLAEAEKTVAARRAGQEIDLGVLPTDYPDLDRLLAGGLWPGELLVMAARPGMGKTTFAINIVRHVSLGREARVKPAAIFSLEMPNRQIAKNILSAVTSIPTHKMRGYDFTDQEFEDVKQADKALRLAPIYIDDTPGISVSQLRARSRRLRHRHGVKLIVVDYLQLMRGPANRKDNREQEVAEISRSLKELARELKISVIVLSQLNRSPEQRDIKGNMRLPQLSDLRESGAIEQDADVVVMLYRPEYYDVEKLQRPVSVGEALVLKNRNGATGRVKLTFFKEFLRFETYTPEHREYDVAEVGG